MRQQYKSNETQSGGAGADDAGGEDGDVVNAIHPFEFMGGRLATMLWQDGIRIFAGGDDTNFTGDTIIPDGHPGSGSSVPGGPGVRPTVEAKPAQAAIRAKKQKSDHKTQLLDETRTLISKLKDQAEKQMKEAQCVFGSVDQDRVMDLGMEALLDDCQRYQEKVDAATSDSVREGYEDLLSDAEARLVAARAKKKKMKQAAVAEEARLVAARAEKNASDQAAAVAAAAVSSAASASPSSSLPGAPATPGAIEGGAGSGEVLTEDLQAGAQLLPA